jgi:hypothetical protein
MRAIAFRTLGRELVGDRVVSLLDVQPLDLDPPVVCVLAVNRSV